LKYATKPVGPRPRFHRTSDIRSARKELPHDLHYTGDMNDSAAMNMWLHEEVMQKLAANGGKIPQDLLDK
jgi:hypothetical protein